MDVFTKRSTAVVKSAVKELQEEYGIKVCCPNVDKVDAAKDSDGLIVDVFVLLLLSCVAVVVIAEDAAEAEPWLLLRLVRPTDNPTTNAVMIKAIEKAIALFLVHHVFGGFGLTAPSST